jgi:hypothetical protein
LIDANGIVIGVVVVGMAVAVVGVVVLVGVAVVMGVEDDGVGEDVPVLDGDTVMVGGNVVVGWVVIVTTFLTVPLLGAFFFVLATAAMLIARSIVAVVDAATFLRFLRFAGLVSAWIIEEGGEALVFFFVVGDGADPVALITVPAVVDVWDDDTL